MFNIFVIVCSVFLNLSGIIIGSVSPSVFIFLSLPAMIILWALFIRFVFCKKDRILEAVRIFAVLAFIFSVPVTVIACSKGITLGMQVPFNKTLWEKNIDNRIRYYMTADIIKSVNKSSFSKEAIILKLGEPYDKDDDWFIAYFLKPDSLIALAYSELAIEFDEHGLVRHISIEHID